MSKDSVRPPSPHWQWVGKLFNYPVNYVTVVLGEQKVRNLHQAQIINDLKEKSVLNMKMMLLKF